MAAIWTCERCGVAFAGRGNRPAKFCSMACRVTRVARTCEGCGVEFTAVASKADERRYCTRACYLANAPKPGRPRDETNWTTEPCRGCGEMLAFPHWRPKVWCSRECQHRSTHSTTTCPTCGVEFEYGNAWPRTYCSNPCAGKGIVANIRHWEASSFVATCEQCAVEFTTTPKRSRGRFCSMECWGRWLSESGVMAGENSPNWKGGYEPYYGASWPAARRAVVERDKVCQDCGAAPDGRSLDVHHIRPFRLFGRDRHEEANRADNLVALCRFCHIAREWATTKHL